MKRLFFTLAIGLSLALTGPASADYAGEVKQAEKLLADGEYARAFDEYLAIATRNNNPLAQLSLALFYQNGWGRAVDLVQACQWYEKSAQGQIPLAADAYGSCLAAGSLREPDYPQAIVWYQKAADLGHHYSLCRMGDLYIAGSGVPRDAAGGVALCRQSAEQGSVQAMLHLAGMYMKEDTPRDPAQAFQWYAMAAEYQSIEAEFQLGVMLRDGVGVQQDPISARTRFEKAASRGYISAYYETAVLYFNAPTNPDNGLWYENDMAKAYLWLSATQQRSQDAAQRAGAHEMLKDVGLVMPKNWKADLDAKVSAHLKQYPATK